MWSDLVLYVYKCSIHSLRCVNELIFSEQLLTIFVEYNYNDNIQYLYSAL